MSRRTHPRHAAPFVVSASSPAGDPLAIKLAVLARGPKERKVKGSTQSDAAIGLAVERRAYALQLPRMPGVPALPAAAYGEALGYRYLVMQRLGQNLKQRAADVGGRFSPPAIAHVASSLVGAHRVCALTCAYVCVDSRVCLHTMCIRAGVGCLCVCPGLESRECWP